MHNSHIIAFYLTQWHVAMLLGWPRAAATAKALWIAERKRLYNR
jgi:hypothetical protein